LLLLYIIDLPEIINNKSLIILLADDPRMLVSNPNPTDLQNDINIILARIQEWFNLLEPEFYI